MKPITTIEELKILSLDQPLDCAIVLSGGLLSRKSIRFVNDIFQVENHIDGSTQELTEKELFDTSCTNIGKALNMGALMRI